MKQGGFAVRSLLYALLLLTLASGFGCKAAAHTWVCTATAASNGAVALCEGTLRTDTGMLCIQNPAAVAVRVYLYDAADMAAPRYTLDVAAAGVCIQYQVSAGVDFVIGLSANEKAAGEMTVVVSDRADGGPYSGEG